MHGEDPNQWDRLIIERGAAPVPLDDAAFRQWMAGRPVFVSSPMNAELNPDRDAVRAWLESWGALAVMWETLAPRDERADKAYLDGVDRSYAMIILAGSSYGVADRTGFSPTHQEVNRAGEAHKPRLLFTKAEVSDAARDGKLNRMLSELYHEVSGSSYADAERLKSQLERQFRELAAREESLWIKLGPLIFPGQVRQRRSGGRAVYSIGARVRDGAVRRALGELGGFGPIRADRLTWNTGTQAVAVEEVESVNARSSESVVSVVCNEIDDRQTRGFGGMNMSVGGAGGRSWSPSEQASEWAREAVFGERTGAPDNRQSHDLLRAFTAHDGPALPELLRRHEAEGWLAEGITRLFVIEHLTRRYGGHFDQLDVGPATAAGVRVKARFVPAGGGTAAEISGIVPRA